MLTTEQLERIAYALAMGEDRTRETDRHVSSEARICLAAVNGELHRRQRGPFTLAESIASGRPFRRKVWAPLSWARISEHVYNGGALIVFVVGGSAIPAGPADITATDYEVQE